MVDAYLVRWGGSVASVVVKLKPLGASFFLHKKYSSQSLARGKMVRLHFTTSRENASMAAGMTKTQLVKAMAEKLELTNKQAATFLETLTDVAVKEAKKNGVFVLPGFGRLKKVQRKARMGRNPQTGEPIQIKAKTVAKFYVAKAMKNAIAPPKK